MDFFFFGRAKYGNGIEAVLCYKDRQVCFCGTDIHSHAGCMRVYFLAWLLDFARYQLHS